MHVSSLLFLLVTKSLSQAIYSMPNRFQHSHVVQNISCYDNRYNITHNDFENVANITINEFTSRVNKILMNKTSNNLIYGNHNNASCGISVTGNNIVSGFNINYSIFAKNNCDKNLTGILCDKSIACNQAIVCCNNDDPLRLPCNNNYILSYINFTIPSIENNIIKKTCNITEDTNCFQIKKSITPTTELPTTKLSTTKLSTTKLSTTELPTTELPTTELPEANSTISSTTNSAEMLPDSLYLYLIVFLNYLG